jgi:hypothetical protein
MIRPLHLIEVNDRFFVASAVACNEAIVKFPGAAARHTLVFIAVLRFFLPPK